MRMRHWVGVAITSGAAVAALAHAALGAAAPGAVASYGGGALPSNSALVYYAGTQLITLRRTGDGRVRVHAQLRANCGGVTLDRTVALGSDGTFSLKAKVTGATTASVRISGTVGPDRATGLAAVRLRVRSAKKVKSCVAPAAPFDVERSQGIPASAYAPAAGGQLYAGLTSQSIPARLYPIVVRTSTEGRTITGVAYEYFCRNRTVARASEASEFSVTGNIAADGHFTWHHTYQLGTSASSSVHVNLTVSGRFRANQVTGTIKVVNRVVAAGKTQQRCIAPEPIRFTAVAAGGG